MIKFLRLHHFNYKKPLLLWDKKLSNLKQKKIRYNWNNFLPKWKFLARNKFCSYEGTVECKQTGVWINKMLRTLNVLKQVRLQLDRWIDGRPDLSFNKFLKSYFFKVRQKEKKTKVDFVSKCCCKLERHCCCCCCW